MNSRLTSTLRACFSVIATIAVAMTSPSAAHGATDWNGKTTKSFQLSFMNYAQSNRQLQNHVLQRLIASRCQAYLPDQAAECKRASFLAIKTLKARLVTFTHPSSGVEMTLPAVFGYDLVAILQDPRSRILFSNWKSQLQMAALGAAPISLYDTVLAVVGGNEVEALSWMGALFQDVSFARVQIAWIKANIAEPTPTLIENVKSFEELIANLIDLQSGQFKTISPVAKYPAFIETLQGRIPTTRMYHFYVPALLSSRLKAKGVTAEVSFFVGYMLTYIYEVLKMGNPIPQLMIEPGSLSRNAMADSYMAYRGSLWAAGLNDFAMTPAQYAISIGAQPAKGLVELGKSLKR